MKLLTEQITLSNLEPIKRERVVEESETEGKTFVAGYKVPIWKLNTENANGRIYPLELGERIVTENKVTLSYDGHPMNELGLSFSGVRAVGKNPTIEEDVLYVEAFFVDDDYHKKIENLLNNGAAVGLSSVGYGELLETNVVNPDTFSLVRYFDFVINPSYGVYIDKEKIVSNEEPTEETVSNSSSEEEENLSTEDKVSEEELQFIKDIYEIRNLRRKI